MDAAFGYWLAGFIDGEGCFGIYRDKSTYSCRFTMRVREDEREIMELIHHSLGIGRLYEDTRQTNPMLSWRIASLPDCESLVQFLDQYPLRAKKLHEYEIWREAVSLKREHNPHGKRGHGISTPVALTVLHDRLKTIHSYQPSR